jgi:type IV secretion system protein VirB10
MHRYCANIVSMFLGHSPLGLVVLIATSLTVRAQEPTTLTTRTQSSASELTTQSAGDLHHGGNITIPAGTKVLLRLKHGIRTKNVKVGDGVYAETSFPLTINDQIVIPPGTYVEGVVTDVKRGGHIKGKAELLVHFRTLIFPNGYTVSMPGQVESAPDSNIGHVMNKEGTIQAEGQKAERAKTVVSTAATGALIGAVASDDTEESALIGAGAGALAGFGIAMLTRGQDVRLDPGSTIEMIIGHPVTLSEAKPP